MTRDATGNVRKKFLTPTKLENVSTYYLHTSTPHRKTSMLGALRNQKCPGRGMGGGGRGRCGERSERRLEFGGIVRQYRERLSHELSSHALHTSG